MYLASRSKVKYLDLRDTESSIPSVAGPVGGVQDTIRELIFGLVPGHTSTKTQTHLNRLKDAALCGITIGLGRFMQDVYVYVAQRFPLQPGPSANIPDFGLL